MMAVLYDVSVPAINQHLKTIFTDNELDENSVIKKYLITAADGKSYNTKHYNLHAIIAVGFKVNNERLKNGGTVLTNDYFEKQLEKVREIRLSRLEDVYITSKKQ